MVGDGKEEGVPRIHFPGDKRHYLHHSFHSPTIDRLPNPFEGIIARCFEVAFEWSKLTDQLLQDRVTFDRVECIFLRPV